MAKTNTKHSTSRDAAQDLQKDACKLYALVTGLHTGSSRDDEADIKPRQSGQAGTDVVLSERARKICDKLGFPASCECKNTKIWDLQRAVRQARANAKGSGWLLVMKRRSKFKEEHIDPIVVMDLKTFMELLVKLGV